MTLIIPIIIAAISYTLGMTVLRKRYRLRTILIANFFLSYGLIIGQSAYFERHYREQLYRYDVNGNEMFESSEQTEGFSLAQERVVHDTGRTFAPILGFIISLMTTLLLSLSLFCSNWVIRKLGRSREYSEL